MDLLLRYVSLEGTCWVWTGGLARAGYGKTTRNGRTVLAHRVVWEYLLDRTIGEGMELDHLCRVHACVNPDHLEEVTRKVNNARGYSPSSINARRTHCTKGHPLTGANVRHYNGRRQCRTCENRSTR
jgi:hypothetical protein